MRARREGCAEATAGRNLAGTKAGDELVAPAIVAELEVPARSHSRCHRRDRRRRAARAARELQGEAGEGSRCAGGAAQRSGGRARSEWSEPVPPTRRSCRAWGSGVAAPVQIFRGARGGWGSSSPRSSTRGSVPGRSTACARTSRGAICFWASWTRTRSCRRASMTTSLPVIVHVRRAGAGCRRRGCAFEGRARRGLSVALVGNSGLRQIRRGLVRLRAPRQRLRTDPCPGVLRDGADREGTGRLRPLYLLRSSSPPPSRSPR